MALEALGQVATGTTGLDKAVDGQSYLNKLVGRTIVTPNGIENANIGGFVFDYEGETQVNLQATITDHFAEDNTALQDHIAFQPDRLTLRGFVGELTFKKQEGILGMLNALQSRLTTVPAYLGPKSAASLAKFQNNILKTQNAIQQLQQAAARIKNLVAMFSKAKQGTRQQDAFGKLESLMKTAQLVSVKTPYGNHDNMVIESVIFIQAAETKGESDIVVTLRQMRFAELTVKIGVSARDSRSKWKAGSREFGGMSQGAQRSLTLNGVTDYSKIVVGVPKSP